MALTLDIWQIPEEKISFNKDRTLKLHFVKNEDESATYVVSIERLKKLLIKDFADTPLSLSQPHQESAS